MQNINKNSGFTLIEIVITTLILGILVIFALPQYGRVVEKQNERDAIIQLQSVYTAVKLYMAQAGTTTAALPPPLNADVTIADATTLNDTFRTNLILDNNKEFKFDDDGSLLFEWSDGKIIRSNLNAPLGADNPCCEGTCRLPLTTLNECP